MPYPYGSNLVYGSQYISQLQQSLPQAYAAYAGLGNQEFLDQKKQENSNKKLLLLEDTI